MMDLLVHSPRLRFQLRCLSQRVGQCLIVAYPPMIFRGQKVISVGTRNELLSRVSDLSKLYESYMKELGYAVQDERRRLLW